jgi:hypothetical protein
MRLGDFSDCRWLRCRCGAIAALLALLLTLSPRAFAQNVPFVFLVQNSGWMEPFYSDTRSTKFDAAVSAFIERAAPPNAPIIIASFNKDGEIAGRPSPFVVYSGAAESGVIRAAVGKIDLPIRTDRRLANSDYSEALVATLKNVLKAQSAVVFMVTNNKSAPNGRERQEDGNVVERTEAFNTLLKNSSDIARIVAWPLRFAATGHKFSERGLVIYGIAYGEDASEPLRRSANDAAVRQLLRDPPVRLKPLSFDPLELVLTRGNNGDLDWYSDPAGRIVIDGVPNGGVIIQMKGTITNVHYPYVIESGRMVARWTTPMGTQVASRVRINPQDIAGLQPFASMRDVLIKLAVSPVERPDWFSDQLAIPGVLSIELTDLKLGLAPEYVKKMHDIFGVGAAPRPDVPQDLPPQAPKIFINYKNVSTARTEVPLSLNVSFFPWPLIGVIAGAAALLAAIAAGVMLLVRESAFRVMIDGEERMVSLCAFQSKEVAGAFNNYIVSRGAFGVPIVKPKSTKPSS